MPNNTPNVFPYTADKIECNLNKVTVINNESTDEQYPSAKAVYSALQSLMDVPYEDVFFQDSTSGTVYQLTVVDDKLTLEQGTATATITSDCCIKDTATGLLYSISVVDSKLMLTETTSDTFVDSLSVKALQSNSVYSLTLTNEKLVLSKLGQASNNGGSSITIVEVVESDVDGGYNIIKFSDGNEINVKNGRSAYHCAASAGYTGTEEEFAQKLAQETPKKLSQLENDSGYIKNTVANLAYYYDKNNTYNKTETNELISAIPKFKRRVVDKLPEVGEEETLYLLRISSTDKVNTNLFEEWIWVEGAWDPLGAQKIDLVDYTLKEEVPNMVTEVLEKVYAVGAIYISATNVNPAKLFGFGEWTQIKDRFLLSAGDSYGAGTTGGEAEHQLVADELPKIGGYIQFHNDQDGTNCAAAGSVSGYTKAMSPGYVNASKYRDGGVVASGTKSYGRVEMKFGGNAAHNNMPPYLAVYMWIRVS